MNASTGYFIVFAVIAAGVENFVTRINANQSAHSGYTSSGAGQYHMSGSQNVCVCSGFPNHTHIRFKAQKGECSICGLGWTSEVNVPTVPHGIVHSDNVIGNPGSLSDEKIKSGVTELDPATCLDLCNTLAPCAYLRTDNDEIRTGLIAQEVEATLASYSMPILPIIGSKMASVDPGSFDEPGTAPEDLMTLSYERLVPFLLGAVQRLTERNTQLEG